MYTYYFLNFLLAIKKNYIYNQNRLKLIIFCINLTNDMNPKNYAYYIKYKIKISLFIQSRDVMILIFSRIPTETE